MPLSELKSEFNASAHKIGRRDCKVQGVSAVRG